MERARQDTQREERVQRLKEYLTDEQQPKRYNPTRLLRQMTDRQINTAIRGEDGTLHKGIREVGRALCEF